MSMEQIVAAGRTVCALDAEATKTRFAPTQARGLSPDLARSRPISPDLRRLSPVLHRRSPSLR
jgi:hypothetical protein